MNARTSTAVLTEPASSNEIHEWAVDFPEHSSVEEFEVWLESELIDLEERFGHFVTRNSLTGSIGR